MKFSITSILVLFTFFLQAQVRGTIVDTESEALPGASAALYQDGELISGTTTNRNGQFELKAKPGQYELQVSFISFEPYSQKINLSNAPLNLGTIKLQASKTALEEVTVEGEANLVEFRQDKRIYNVSKDLTTTGSNASEILNNLPSVDVDIEGNISLRGSQNVRILIDGKPSGLIGTDPATALRTLQAGMIEKVEVITNPSARYEAQGEAGIINIVLKKQREDGLNGNFEATVGNPENYGAAAGVNYRTGRMNFFTNLGFNYRNSPGGGFTNQTFTLEDTAYAFNSTREQLRGGSSATLRLGADYSLTENQTLTGTFLFRPSLGNNLVTLTYDDYDQNEVLTQTQVREDDEIETRSTLEGDLHYEKQLEGEDHKWTMDFRYQDSDDRESSTIRQYSIINVDDQFQRVSNQEDEQNILFQTDYVKPITKIRSFETGARLSVRNIINDYEVSQRNAAGVYESLDLYTNKFNYNENIYAAYAIYNDGIGKKFTYQIGLRAEYTGIETKLVRENITNPREYLNLFPSTFLTWKINKFSDLQGSYSRRISRPGFRALLPFFSFSDNRNFFSGNPNLNPEFTDSYELGYLRYLGQATVYGGFYYRHRTGVTERIRTVNDTGFTEIFPINLAVQDAYGIELTYSHPVTKWLRLNADINIYQVYNVGEFEGINYGSETFTARGRTMASFSFWKSDLQLTFNFRAPRRTAQGTTEGIYTANVGWSKDILKGDGTLTFSVRDLFNSRKRRSYSSGENFTSESEFQWRVRQVNLTFVYRLNQRKQRERRQGGFEDEDFGA